MNNSENIVSTLMDRDEFDKALQDAEKKAVDDAKRTLADWQEECVYFNLKEE